MKIKEPYEVTHKLSLYPKSKVSHIVSSINKLDEEIKLRKESKKSLPVILFNLFIHQNEKIRTPRSKATPTVPIRYNPSDIRTKSTNATLDRLNDNGYVVQTKGEFDLSSKTGKETTIIATDKLRRWFKDNLWTHKDINWTNPEYVILRKRHIRKNSKNILTDYKDGERSNWIREELTKYNKLINNSEIHLGDECFVDVALSRVFIDFDIHAPEGGALFAFGGRMYGPWCDYSSESRKRILINDEKTIELDYQAAHVRAMYMVKTGKPYQYGDPYQLFINSNEIPRSVVKQAATIMQNTASVSGAVRALESSYESKSDEKIEEYKKVKKTAKPSDIIRYYMDKHSDISSFYLKDKQMGAHIQYWESSMLFEVVIQLTNMGIPVLTVYDSFIVQKQYEDLVTDLMNNTPYIKR